MAKKKRVLLELPFALEAPRLVNQSVGIDRLILSAQLSQDSETTVLDAPDHRLLRAGVALGHRVVDGMGEWYLDAPNWAPWLPVDHVEQMGATGDLPADFSELVRPFRRRATLGPVASVARQRQVYVIKDAEDTTLGSLTDERITIRRGGLTTARVREATLVPSPAMTAEQRTFLADTLVAAGGVPVTDFPHPLRRLGSAGAGLSDYPEPRELNASASLEAFVSAMFASQLRAVMRADLALRSSELARQAKIASRADDDTSPIPGTLTAEPVFAELEHAAHQVRALAGVLEPTWREKLEADLGALLGGERRVPIAQLDERYPAVLDALVAAARAPQVGDWGTKSAKSVLQRQVDLAIDILRDRANGLTAESPAADWAATHQAANQVLVSADALGVLFGRSAKKLHKHVRALAENLGIAQLEVAEPTEAELEAMGPQAAYAKGLELAQSRRRQLKARTAFLALWPELRPKVEKARSRK